MNATTESTLPKFAMISARAEDKAAVQALRKRLDLTEKQVVEALLIAATKHEALLQQTVGEILEAEILAKKAAKAAKA